MQTLRPLARAAPVRPAIRPQRRAFVPNPFAGSGPQTLTASRTIPHASKLVYTIISDVASYARFLPYCQSSTVTKRSSPTSHDGQTYPEEAQLVIGFTPEISESFWSRVYCAPNQVVEAVSGDTNTTLRPDEVPHHNPRPTNKSEDPARDTRVLTHLLTRWTLRPYPYKPPPYSAIHPTTTHKNHEETSDLPGQEKTEVNLRIEYQFANPMYGALSAAAAPKVAEKMIEAFERRVKEVVEGPGWKE
jgi:coenzyme Q-binding protein COQ10